MVEPDYAKSVWLHADHFPFEFLPGRHTCSPPFAPKYMRGPLELLGEGRRRVHCYHTSTAPSQISFSESKKTSA
jgi:hypothetical protein